MNDQQLIEQFKKHGISHMLQTHHVGIQCGKANLVDELKHLPNYNTPMLETYPDITIKSTLEGIQQSNEEIIRKLDVLSKYLISIGVFT